MKYFHTFAFLLIYFLIPGNSKAAPLEPCSDKDNKRTFKNSIEICLCGKWYITEEWGNPLCGKGSVPDFLMVTDYETTDIRNEDGVEVCTPYVTNFSYYGAVLKKQGQVRYIDIAITYKELHYDIDVDSITYLYETKSTDREMRLCPQQQQQNQQQPQQQQLAQQQQQQQQ